MRGARLRNLPRARVGWGQRLLHAFAMGLLSCDSNPLRSIGMGVRMEWVGSPAERVIQVEFWKPGECFVLPSGTRVLLNGRELHVTLAGGKRPPPSRRYRRQQVESLDWGIANCEPALLSSEPFIPAAPRADRNDVEMYGRTGFAEIEGLLAQRSLSITSGPLGSGKMVTLEWSPSSDIWPNPVIGAEVYVDVLGRQRVVISGPKLYATSGRFEFRMPEVPPGLVTLSVSSGAARPTARVNRCHGFSECSSRGVLGAPPIEVRVE